MSTCSRWKDIDGDKTMSFARESPARSALPALKTRWKIVISIALLLHLTAVIVSPLSIEGSPIAGRLWLLFRPYVQAAYLNHGYHFFAPQPGPSHLLRYELTLPDGKQVTGSIPNRKVNRPRLFYHRHFMLTEFLNMLREQAEIPGEAQEQARQVFENYSQSYASHLLAEHGAERVTIHLVRHLIPYPQDVIAGRQLSDPSLYQELYHRTYEADAR